MENKDGSVTQEIEVTSDDGFSESKLAQNIEKSVGGPKTSNSFGNVFVNSKKKFITLYKRK